MSAAEGGHAEPFYFRSYDSVIGVARSVDDLQREMGRLAGENPEALEYHLREGHIVRWLESLNEREVAEQVKQIQTADEARAWTSRPRGGDGSRKARRASGSPSRRKSSRRAR